MAAQQLRGRKRTRPRPSLSPYGEDVEVAEWLAAWPRAKKDQIATLTSIPPHAWTMIPEVRLGTRFFTSGHRLLADYDVDTKHGRRRFNVWKTPRVDDRVIVIKQANPGMLVASCTLRPVGDKLEASFHLLSGKEFAKQKFEANMHDQVFYFYQLRYAAMDLALNQGLLESQGHPVKLLLNGFAHELCDFTPLYRMSDGPLTLQSLEARLSYLQGLTPAELEDLSHDAAKVFDGCLPWDAHGEW